MDSSNISMRLYRAKETKTIFINEIGIMIVDLEQEYLMKV